MGSHDNRQLAELADSALQLLPGLPTLDRGKREQRALGDQLHSSAIALWNRLCVKTCVKTCVTPTACGVKYLQICGPQVSWSHQFESECTEYGSMSSCGMEV